MTCCANEQQTKRVPLQRPSEGLILRRSITGAPIFNDNLCGGNPLTFKEFKNSVG